MGEPILIEAAVPQPSTDPPMLTFAETPYGFTFRNSEFFTPDVAQRWSTEYRDIIKRVAAKGRPFHQFVDLRGFRVGPPETQAVIAEGMRFFKASGGGRSIVLMDSAIAVNQVRRLAKESGMYAWERYIDIATHPNYEPVVTAWLVEGKDPDLASPAVARAS